MKEQKEKKLLADWNDFLRGEYKFPPNYELVKKEKENPFVKEKEDKKNETFWGGIFRKKNLKRPESMAILYLRKNGVAEPMYLTPKNEMFNIGGKVYHQRKDCKYLITKDKIPLAIIPEEGFIPTGNEEYYKDLDMQKRCSEHQDFAIKAIRHAELVRMGYDDKKTGKFNPKVAIAIVIIAIIVYALFKGGLV